MRCRPLKKLNYEIFAFTLDIHPIFFKNAKKSRIAGAMREKTLKASHEGLRPQARVGAQPPKAALSAETEAVRKAD